MQAAIFSSGPIRHCLPCVSGFQGPWKHFMASAVKVHITFKVLTRPVGELIATCENRLQLANGGEPRRGWKGRGREGMRDAGRGNKERCEDVPRGRISTASERINRKSAVFPEQVGDENKWKTTGGVGVEGGRATRDGGSPSESGQRAAASRTWRPVSTWDTSAWNVSLVESECLSLHAR